MNTQNYASLEASKRLHDAGIVLETEKYFEIPYTEDSETFCETRSNGTDAAVVPLKIERVWKLPKPSMAEVLRKLSLKDDTEHGYTHLVFYSHGVSWVTNTDESFFPYKENNGNIIDALIDLLIFVRKEKP